MNAKDKLRAPENRPIQELVKKLDLNTRAIAKLVSASYSALPPEAVKVLSDRAVVLVEERRKLRAAMELKLKEQRA